MDHSTMDSIEGFILAGGASSRMGADKSRLVLDGRTFIERISDALSSITPNIRIVGTHAGPPHSSLAPVPDIYPAWGALGGLHAALAACQTEWAAVVACDLPFVTGDLFLRLAQLRVGFDAVAPIQQDGRLQPLCSLYRISACRALAEKLITSGERKPVTLLQSVHTRWALFAELEDVEGANLFFANMNTPDDYLRAQQKGASLRTEGVDGLGFDL
jgi:molybdopterin-guanine dinucleotide biosynthesis protein A